MKKLFLMLALVGGGILLNACDKDNDGKDPAASLIDYVGKSYSTFAADCEKAGYKKITMEGSLDDASGYEKNGEILLATPQTGNIQMVGKVNEATFTTVDQIVSNLKAADSRFNKYKIEDTSFYLHAPSASDSEEFATYGEFETAIKAKAFGYYSAYRSGYMIDRKGVFIVAEYEYSVDEETNKGTISEAYSLAI